MLLRLICLCTTTHALNSVTLNREAELNNVVTIKEETNAWLLVGHLFKAKYD